MIKAFGREISPYNIYIERDLRLRHPRLREREIFNFSNRFNSVSATWNPSLTLIAVLRAYVGREILPYGRRILGAAGLPVQRLSL